MSWDWTKMFSRQQQEHEPHMDHSETPWSSGSGSNRLHPEKKSLRKRQKLARRTMRRWRKH